jgi:hypothetical protein
MMRLGEARNVLGGWANALTSRMIARLPKEWQVVLSNARTLAYDYGQAATVRSGVPADRSGGTLPWYTYPAIEYLSSFDLSGRSVFEYGAGQSSAFWSARASSVTSVEHDAAWYDQVKAKKHPNHQLLLEANLERYPSVIASLDRQFDVIVIDGRARTRCAEIAPQFLAPDGLLVFDNTDWYPRCAQRLRERGLFQVDFSGFGPINSYTWTTSVFLRAATSLQRAYRAPKPMGGIAGDGDSTD